MNRKTKLIIVLLVVIICGSCIAFLKGRLQNQTATIAVTQASKIRSLVTKQNIVNVSLPLDNETWKHGITVPGVRVQNESIIEEKWNISNTKNGNLIVNGTHTDITLAAAHAAGLKFAWLFNAKLLGLHINFSETPYLHTVVSSNPDVFLRFYVGINRSSAENKIVDVYNITEIDKTLGVIWINVSYPQYGKEINHFKMHHVTINVAKRLQDYLPDVLQLNMSDQIIVGLQIREYLIGYEAVNNSYSTVINSMYLTKEPIYDLIPSSGSGSSVDEGTVAYVIRKTDIVGSREDCPYLQRVYISYTMDAPQNTRYTIYLLCKEFKEVNGTQVIGNLTAVRIGFVFLHTLSNMQEIGTYIDWRRPIQLDHDFEPLATLNTTMNVGDYAILFTVEEQSQLLSFLKNNHLKTTIQLHDVSFTFSTLQYSAFIFHTINAEVLIIASIFTLTIAGVLPAFLMFYLFYLYKRNKLKEGKGTIMIVAIVGLALRLILAPVTAYADDTQIFAELGALYFGSGVLGAQWVSLPGFVYLETVSYFPYALLRAFGFHDYQFLFLDIYSVELLFTKIPSILGDFGSFYYIQKMATKYAPDKKILLPGLYLLNPLTVYISGILGQFDPIFIFAVIASIYYLVAEYNSFKATIFSGFAAILNPVGIATFIQLLVNVYFRSGRKDMIKRLLLGTGIFTVAMLPFFFEAKSPVVLASFERLIGAVPGETFYGKNYNFYAYGTLINSSVGYGLTFRFLLEMLGFELGSIFFPYVAASIFLVFVGIFTYKICKAHAKTTHGLIYTGTFMLVVTSLFQLTFPTIFDQFAIWIAGLLLVSYILCQNRKFLLIFTTICISTGFIYIIIWRNYLHLISGVEVAPLVNPSITNLASALIGVLYSIILFIILAIIVNMWMQKAHQFQKINS